MVAIAKAVFENSDIIVFDEPTALLTDDETQLLFSIIRRLRDAGKGIIYITHRLEEVFGVCDRVSVLKDGALVRTMKAGEVDQDGLMRLMVGRSMADMYMIRRLPPGEPVLSRARPEPRAALPQRQLSTCARAKSSACSDWSARDARKCCGRSTAPTAPLPARSP